MKLKDVQWFIIEATVTAMVVAFGAAAIYMVIRAVTEWKP